MFTICYNVDLGLLSGRSTVVSFGGSMGCAPALLGHHFQHGCNVVRCWRMELRRGKTISDAKDGKKVLYHPK